MIFLDCNLWLFAAFIVTHACMMPLLQLLYIASSQKDVDVCAIFSQTTLNDRKCECKQPQKLQLKVNAYAI